MEKVFVTGSTGFIGSHLVKELTRRGYIIDENDCTRVYHLACPSTTQAITENPIMVMETILDYTREVIHKWPNCQIINASSIGAEFIDESPQGAYNVAKRCMEIYLMHSGVDFINYRLPSVYGEDAHEDSFIVRCVRGTAYRPAEPNKLHYIAHVDDVVDALIDLKPLIPETITLGEIYEQFNSGRRGLHRPESC